MIDHVDHIVLTTRDLPSCIRFYTEVLGMKLESFKTPTETRQALKFGSQKLNLHEWGKEFTPRAHVAAPGTLDLCFIAAVPLEQVIAKLNCALLMTFIEPSAEADCAAPRARINPGIASVESSPMSAITKSA